MADARRYVLDPLYGIVRFPTYVWHLLSSPELQRLREVRMSNINSLTLTGTAGVNRFEHSLGTAYLATQTARASGLDQSQSRLLILSCLLHDVGSAAFGHSVQYILDRKGYSHEAVYEIVSGMTAPGSSFKNRNATFEDVYFGTHRMLPSLLDDKDLKSIGETVGGKGALGQLVSGTMDLDNIDNVFRLAFHMGLTRDAETPKALARAMTVEDGTLVIADSARPLIEIWHETRKALYRFLLLNPDEFAAKCMLEQAALIASQRSPRELNWQDVDFGLVRKLYDVSDESKQIIRRLMLGDVYGCLCILSTADASVFDRRVQSRSGVHSKTPSVNQFVPDSGRLRAPA